MSDESKVVKAFPMAELPENPLQIESRNPHSPYFCKHDSVRLNEHERTIHCACCGAALDPFDFVLDNAKTIQRAWEGYRITTNMISELNQRVDVLKKEEKRIRAQIKRLNDKSGIISVRGNG